MIVILVLVGIAFVLTSLGFVLAIKSFNRIIAILERITYNNETEITEPQIAKQVKRIPVMRFEAFKSNEIKR